MLPQMFISSFPYRNYTVGSTWRFDGHETPVTITFRYIQRMPDGGIVFSLEGRDETGEPVNVYSVRKKPLAKLVRAGATPTYDAFQVTANAITSVKRATIGFSETHIVNIRTGEFRRIPYRIPRFPDDLQVHLGRLFDGATLFRMPDATHVTVVDEHELTLARLCGGIESERYDNDWC